MHIKYICTNFRTFQVLCTFSFSTVASRAPHWPPVYNIIPFNNRFIVILPPLLRASIYLSCAGVTTKIRWHFRLF